MAARGTHSDYPTGRRSIAGWPDPGTFDHQDDRPFRRARPMQHTFRHHETLPWRQGDRPSLQLDHKPAIDHVEELIFSVVLVPVKLSLHHAKPHDAIVDPAERLVIPGISAGISERLHVDLFERTRDRVQVYRIGRGGLH